MPSSSSQEETTDVELAFDHARLGQHKRVSVNYLAVAVAAIASSGATFSLSPITSTATIEEYRQEQAQFRERIVKLESAIDRLDEKIEDLPPEWLRREIRHILEAIEDIKDDLKEHKH